ncbi:unnamed protein product [Caenorhabditis nigoni]
MVLIKADKRAADGGGIERSELVEVESELMEGESELVEVESELVEVKSEESELVEVESEESELMELESKDRNWWRWNRRIGDSGGGIGSWWRIGADGVGIEGSVTVEEESEADKGGIGAGGGGIGGSELVEVESELKKLNYLIGNSMKRMKKSR